MALQGTLRILASLAVALSVMAGCAGVNYRERSMLSHTCYATIENFGDEEILVLQGGLRDERGQYGPGDIIRSETGSIHSERALPGEDCYCFVIYRGEHEFV